MTITTVSHSSTLPKYHNSRTQQSKQQFRIECQLHRDVIQLLLPRTLTLKSQQHNNNINDSDDSNNDDDNYGDNITTTIFTPETIMNSPTYSNSTTTTATTTTATTTATTTEKRSLLSQKDNFISPSLTYICWPNRSVIHPSFEAQN